MEAELPTDSYISSSAFARTAAAVKQKLRARLTWFEAFIETEMWGIFVSLVMQDGPFVIMRLIALFTFDIITYTNYFFTVKNALILMLQVYRMASLFMEYREKKKKMWKEKRRVVLSELYTNAFLSKTP